MLATPATAEPWLRLVEADPELGPPEELLCPWCDWAEDRVKRTRAQVSPP